LEIASTAGQRLGQGKKFQDEQLQHPLSFRQRNSLYQNDELEAEKALDKRNRDFTKGSKKLICTALHNCSQQYREPVARSGTE